LVILQSPGFVFDESIYVPFAVYVNGGVSLPPDYLSQPLGIALLALMIRFFNFRPYAWRALPVVLGVASIWIIFLLTKAGTRDQSVALLSAGLYGFDVLTFVQSSIAMLDVFFVFFMLAAFYAYWKGRRILAPALLALSTLCKFPGIFGFLVILAMEFYSHTRFKSILSHFLVYALVYLNGFLMLQMVLPTSRVNPLSFFQDVGAAEVSFAGTPTSLLSKPWTWITHPIPISYGVSNYVGMGNPAIWLLTIPAMATVAWKFLRTKNTFLAFLLAWFAATYLLPWYPLALFDSRLMIYYFLPTVGAVTTSISIVALSLLRRIRHKLISGMLLAAYLLVVLYFFILYFPARA
jgi:dolichyl-phosphate-mannose-protein mannosyltransferase